MKTLFAFLFLSMSLQAQATWCVVTTVDWHIETEDGIIVGQTTTTECYEDSGGDYGGSDDQDTGGGNGSTGSSSGGSSSTNTPNTVSNLEEFVDCLSQIVDYQPTENFPSGIRSFTGSGPNDHKGCDLFADNGTLVRAPVSGIVTGFKDDIPRDQNMTQDPSFIEGNQIVIQPDGSFNPQTYEANPGAALAVTIDHLDPGFAESYDIKRNKRVEKGQIIALADNTGSTNIGAHLHLQIVKSDGSYVDPEALIDCQ